MFCSLLTLQTIISILKATVSWCGVETIDIYKSSLWYLFCDECKIHGWLVGSVIFHLSSLLTQVCSLKLIVLWALILVAYLFLDDPFCSDINRHDIINRHRVKSLLTFKKLKIRSWGKKRVKIYEWIHFYELHKTSWESINSECHISVGMRWIVSKLEYEIIYDSAHSKVR